MLRNIVHAEPVVGADGDGFLVTLECGHKLATRKKRTSYECRDCGASRDEKIHVFVVEPCQNKEFDSMMYADIQDALEDAALTLDGCEDDEASVVITHKMVVREHYEALVAASRA